MRHQTTVSGQEDRSSNVISAPEQQGLVENWKRQAISESTLNKLLEKDYDQQNFVLENLRDKDMADISEIHQKMSHLNSTLVTNLDVSLQKNYMALIGDMHKIKDFSLDIENCKDKMHKVQQSLISLHSLFTQNYETIQNKMPLLKNAKEAAVIVQKSIKYLQNLKILKSLVSSRYEITDLVKTSLILQEINEHAPALADLEFYENSKSFLLQVQEQVVKKAEKKFNDALLQKNQIEISQSIQIFFHLGILAEQLEQRANFSLKNSSASWRQVLIKEYSGEYQGALIVQIKNLLTEDYSNAQQMWLLNQSVKASRDPKSMESYETFLSGKNVLKLFDLFWNKQCLIVQQSFQKLQENQSKYTQNYKTVVSSYPRIFGMLENFVNNFNEYVLSFPDSIISYDFPELKKRFLNSLAILSPAYYQNLTQKVSSQSLKVIKLLQTFDQTPFNTLVSNVQSELETGLIVEFNFQAKDNFPSCALIYKQSSKIYISECQKFLQQVKQLYKGKQITIGESFALIYTLSIYKSQILDNLLNQEYNDQVDMEFYDTVLAEYVDYIQEVTRVYYLAGFNQNTNNFLSLYFTSQTQKVAYNQKIFTQMQTFFKNYSPYSYFEKSKYFDQLFLQEYYKYFQGFLRDFCFLIIYFYKNMSQNIDEQTSLGQEIEAMSSIIEKNGSSEFAASDMKLIINLQKIFYVDSKSASQIIQQSQDFTFYLKEGIIQLAFIQRLEQQINKPLISNLDYKESYSSFKSKLIKNIKSLISEYIQENQELISKFDEYDFLKDHH
ncbi:hypothetical protein TTHERM_00137660 (macronuclear) [Tetrahymena thermophila SB210]|uniref:Conserved oligomeric Golgi complex subunit 5 helical domain-containing protein n=1 Tax=Tetrahymena thermophila (strain SB210) TaxID=312017 RepID=I7M8R1_TETTS|nr:hypothetical protein TTHERM_00137660 [Tetrahymena thermophila SB210]EAR99503.2 hypothetical protein TTHERM_00137660 [Tetrahymena thermophila SB210]|eukprot:XP_001019748.2 hypothetical protein TTHERM_00137660 [Tetrahymena thermophila SB210]